MQSSSPTHQPWVLPNGGKVTWAPHSQPRCQSLVTPGHMDVNSTTPADLLVSIDPGLMNMGMAMFYREYAPSDPYHNIYRIQNAHQLAVMGCDDVAKLAAMTISHIRELVKSFTPWMKIPPAIVDVAVEYQYAKDSKIRSFEECLRATVISSPYDSVVFRVRGFSARTAYTHLKIPACETWAKRKQNTKSFIESRLGQSFPRHDAADAVAMGVGLLDKGMVKLTPCELELDPVEEIYGESIYLFDDLP